LLIYLISNLHAMAVGSTECIFALSVGLNVP